MNPKKLQNRYIRRFGTAYGLAFVLSFILQIVFVVVCILSMDRAAYNWLIFSDMGLILQQIVLSILTFVPCFILAGWMVGVTPKTAISLRIDDKPFAFALGLCAIGTLYFANMLTNHLVSVLNLLGLTPESFDMDIPHSVGGVLLYLFAISVVPAVVEEFAMRGMLLGALRRFGDRHAIVISALVFALMHGNFVQIPFALTLGLVFGYLTVATNSILPAVAVHFFNNFTAGVITVVQEFAPAWAANLADLLTVGVMIAAGVIGVILLCRRHKHPFTRCRDTAFDCTALRCTGVFFSSPAMIVCILYYGGFALYDLFV